MYMSTVAVRFWGAPASIALNTTGASSASWTPVSTPPRARLLFCEKTWTVTASP